MSRTVTQTVSESFTTSYGEQISLQLPDQFPADTGLPADYVQKITTLGGDVYQWTYEIDDKCQGVQTVKTKKFVVTHEHPPCCFPGFEVGVTWYAHYCKSAEGTLPEPGAHCKIGLPATPAPTEAPTKAPTLRPTVDGTQYPTPAPTLKPTPAPTPGAGAGAGAGASSGECRAVVTRLLPKI